MKTLINKVTGHKYWELGKIAVGALLLWVLYHMIQRQIFKMDPTAGYIDPSIWMLVLMALICYPILICVSGYMLIYVWKLIGLPSTGNMVLQFNALQPWHKLNLLFASYALLLLAGVGCLIAIC